jgi:hypothetical protein
VRKKQMNLATTSINAHACNSSLKLKLTKLIIIPKTYLNEKNPTICRASLLHPSATTLEKSFKTIAEIIKGQLGVWFPSVHHGVQFKPFEFAASSCIKQKI